MSTVVNASCLALVYVTFCAALPFCSDSKLRFVGRPGSQRLKRHLYQDEDGQASPLNATKSSEHHFIRILLLVLPPCGLMLSLLHTANHVATIRPWLLSSAQKERFAIGVLISIASLALSLGVASDLWASYHVSAPFYLDWVFQLLQLAVGIGLIIVSLSIPRRPAVFWNGLPVDAQYTSSAIARLSYSWIQPLLKQARNLRCIEYLDLPMLDYATRSHTLRDQFPRHPTFDPKSPLWKLVFGTIATSSMANGCLPFSRVWSRWYHSCAFTKCYHCWRTFLRTPWTPVNSGYGY
nr:hypothetical protein CFP56_19205 [Quercus suber]